MPKKDAVEQLVRLATVEQQMCLSLQEFCSKEIARVMEELGISWWVEGEYGLVWLLWGRQLGVPLSEIAKRVVVGLRKQLGVTGERCRLGQSTLVGEMAQGIVLAELSRKPETRELPLVLKSIAQYCDSMRVIRAPRGGRAYRRGRNWDGRYFFRTRRAEGAVGAGSV